MLACFMFMLCGKAFPQTCLACFPFFANDFLYFPRETSGLGVWHYKDVKYYSPDNDPKKRTEDYKYMHNGDNLKGATDIINSDVQGSGWLRNFDFGKFANLTLDVGPDTHGRPNGAFEWGSELLFFKVFNNRKLGWHQSNDN